MHITKRNLLIYFPMVSVSAVSDRYLLRDVSQDGKKSNTRLCVMPTAHVLPYVIWRTSTL